MINSVKGRTQVKQSQERYLTQVGGIQDVTEDLPKSGLCGMSLSVGGLMVWKQFVLLKITRQLRGNNSFDNLSIGRSGLISDDSSGCRLDPDSDMCPCREP